jgi:hypothetical protein
MVMAGKGVDLKAHVGVWGRVPRTAGPKGALARG